MAKTIDEGARVQGRVFREVNCLSWLGMHRTRDRPENLGHGILGLGRSRSRSFSVSVFLGLGISRSRSFSVSVILGFDHSRPRISGSGIFSHRSHYEYLRVDHIMKVYFNSAEFRPRNYHLFRSMVTISFDERTSSAVKCRLSSDLSLKVNRHLRHIDIEFIRVVVVE